MKKTKKRSRINFLAVENIFVPIALVFGIWLSFANPPFHSNDEDRHFYNIYAYAHGSISGLKGFEFPENLVKIVQSYQGIPYFQGKKLSRRQIDYVASIPLNPEVKGKARATFFGKNPGYFMHVPGIWIGLLINDNPLWIQWITRITGLIFYIIFVYIALRITPVHKGLMFLLALTPMFLFQASSISYDTPLLSFYFLLTALIYRFAFGNESRISNRDMLILILLGVLMTASKNGYFLLLFLVLMVPYKKFGNLRNYVIIVLFVLCSYFIRDTYNKYSGPLFSIFEKSKSEKTVATESVKNADTLTENIQKEDEKPPIINDSLFTVEKYGNVGGMQRDFAYGGNVNKNVVLKTPFKYIGILIDNFIMQKKNWVGGPIGRFGYSYTFLPTFLLVLHSFMIILVAFIDVRKDVNIALWKRLFAFIVGLVSCIMIISGFFVGLSPVGAQMVFGVQGRYFAPMVIIMSLLLYNNFFEIKGWHKWKGVILGLYSSAVLAYTIYFFNNTFYEP